MPPKDLALPGGRDVRATLESPDGATACVVACPPHPEHGGTRHDPRLRAVGDALADRGFASLRFDYGRWTGGPGEVTDAETAVAWVGDRYDAVGLFGYSFGGCVALLAAPRADVAAVSALAPARRLGDDLDAVAALAGIRAPVQVVCGSRDDTVDWAPVVERARELGAAVEELPADHFFVGRYDRVGEMVAAFLASHLG